MKHFKLKDFAGELELDIEGKSDTDKYDDKFNEKIEFYQQYPQFYPYVGKNYNKYKILIIGESHYLTEDTKFNNTP